MCVFEILTLERLLVAELTFKRHRRSLAMTQFVIYDLLLMSRSNYVHILYHFRDIAYIG